MKRAYISVEIKTVVFECEDVVRTSSYQDPQDHVIFNDCFD